MLWRYYLTKENIPMEETGSAKAEAGAGLAYRSNRRDQCGGRWCKQDVRGVKGGWNYDPWRCFRDMFSFLRRRKEFCQYCYSLPGRSLPWILAVPVLTCGTSGETKEQKGTGIVEEVERKKWAQPRGKRFLPQIHLPQGSFRLNPWMCPCIYPLSSFLPL